MKSEYMKRTILIAAAAVLGGQIFGSFAAEIAPSNNPAVYSDVPDYGEKYLSPDFVVSTTDGGLAITCRTGDELLLLSPDKKVSKRIQLGGHPAGVALSADGKTAYVPICAPKGKILKIDTQSGEIRKSAPAGHMPRVPILSRNGKTLYLANQFENLVRAFDAQTLAETAKGKTVREPFSLALSPDGKKLYALNQLPEAKGGLYEENIAAAVSVLDAKTLAPVAKIDLPNGSINAEEIVLSPDGKFLYLTHIVGRFNVPTSQVERGWISTNAVSIIDPKSDTLRATFLLDDIELGAANPYGIAFTPDGSKLIVAHSGTHEVSVIDRPALEKHIESKYAANPDAAKVREEICNDLAFLSNIRKRVDTLGYAPRHLAADDKHAYVGLYYSDVLAEIDLEKLSVRKIGIGGNETLNEVRKGDLYFHDARLCFQQWLSCTTCHTEVRSDGLNWDLLNDGIGNPKQSKSMLFAHFTPPSMITAVRKNANVAVRRGIRYIQFTRRPEADSKAIDKYLSSLRPVESPHLENGELSDAAQRGMVIFEQAKCSACHSGEFYTDMKRHDVGSGLNEYKGFKFDTPTLREVWRTAPYLYDGRAKTIFDMFKYHNAENRHGDTQSLTDEDLQDLQAYVESL